MPPDLNALRVFERVASLRSFSAAAKTLGISRSSASRCISNLEASLGARLLQRSTRDVVLTPTGRRLIEHCLGALETLDEAVNFVGQLTASPSGPLKVSCPIGFGMNVLSRHLPAFLDMHPNVDVTLDLVGRPVDMFANGIDVAIRIGRLPDSDLISQRLYTLRRRLCASPDYLARRGTPTKIEDLDEHDTVEMQGPNGRPQTWSFVKDDVSRQVAFFPRVCVNEAVTAYRLIRTAPGSASSPDRCATWTSPRSA